MTINRVFRRATLRFLWPVAVTGVIGLSVLMTAGAAAGPDNSATSKPTIVLLHGAWADSSSWRSVVKRLRHDGFTVHAPANPLRSLSSDSAYISSFLAAGVKRCCWSLCTPAADIGLACGASPGWR